MITAKIVQLIGGPLDGMSSVLFKDFDWIALPEVDSKNYVVYKKVQDCEGKMEFAGYADSELEFVPNNGS